MTHRRGDTRAHTKQQSMISVHEDQPHQHPWPWRDLVQRGSEAPQKVKCQYHSGRQKRKEETEEQDRMASRVNRKEVRIKKISFLLCRGS